MNEAQKKIVLAALAVAVLTILFPPFVVVKSGLLALEGSTVGYAPLWSRGPEIYATEVLKIDVTRLSLQLLALAVCVAGVSLFCRSVR